MNVDAKERTVTIRTLAVNGKKFSRTFFNQLPEDEIYWGEGEELRGEPWGLVLIRAKSRFDDGETPDGYYDEWVIFEKNGELFKSTLPYLAWHRRERFRLEMIANEIRYSCRGEKIIPEESKKAQEELVFHRVETENREKVFQKLKRLPQLFVGV